jgi:hypothetical protein
MPDGSSLFEQGNLYLISRRHSMPTKKSLKTKLVLAVLFLLVGWNSVACNPGDMGDVMSKSNRVNGQSASQYCAYSDGSTNPLNIYAKNPCK